MSELLSRPHLALTLALSCATLAACAHSPAAEPGPAPDPIVTTRTETRLVCPPELDTELAARPEVPASAGPVQGSPESLAFIGERFGWGDAAARLFLDAQAACRAAATLDRADAGP